MLSQTKLVAEIPGRKGTGVLNFGASFKSFFVPIQHVRSRFDWDRTRVTAIIPTYAPSEFTLRLVQDLLRWNPRLFIYVVDDSTPQEQDRALRFLEIVSLSCRVRLLRTPTNTLKAGALNYALRSIERERREDVPDVILTVDDDVVIDKNTVKNLVTELMSFEGLGAVCSQSRVYNKNKNLLTRLQGLEYVGFNAVRLADEGFLQGPLVMHGMLTAFRAAALREVGGFAEGHLIEDYEVTTRLKVRGWSVKSAQHSLAWTIVPERLSQFWRQRTRWSYGGVTVVAGATRLSSVFQDVLGHSMFLSTLGMVLLLVLSQHIGSAAPALARWIAILSLSQLGVSYVFQLWLMRGYQEKDLLDWLIRASIVPEFIYGYMMTLALIGSYLFLSFNMLKKAGSRFFRACGYAEKRWGTRALKI